MCVDGEPFHWDTDAAVIFNGDSNLRLHAGERHRDALLTDEERLIRQILYHTPEGKQVEFGSRRTGLTSRGE
jgi:hypothetical protein